MTTDAPVLCSVLRCDHEAEAAYTTASGDGLPFESAVCLAHLHRLQGGAEYLLNQDDRLIAIGDDLAAAGMWRVVDWNVERSSREHLSALPDSPGRLGVTMQLIGGDRRDMQMLVLSRDDMRQLGQALTMLAGPEE